MQVQVLPFGVLKDWLGAEAATVELPEGATVARLLAQLGEGRSAELLRGIAVSVNAEFATSAQALSEGDEVGLLPPVSGGSEGMEQVVILSTEPIQAEAWIKAAKRGEDGAVVVFDGMVRNHTRFAIRDAWIIHRLGRLRIGETSVLIIVASAHRGPAFDACRWLIDTLKQTVPIWKQETFADGAVWAAGEPFPPGMAVDGAEASHGS